MVDRGLIRFSASFNKNKLEINIIECQGLKDADWIGKSDPYVKLYLREGKHTDVMTKVVNNNLNPVFNESFGFELTQPQVMSLTVIFQVFDSDVGKDGKIGEARVALKDYVELDTLTPMEHNVPLMEMRESPPKFKRTSIVSDRTSIVDVPNNLHNYGKTSTVTRDGRISTIHENMHHTNGHGQGGHGFGHGHGHQHGHGHITIRDLNMRLDEILRQNETDLVVDDNYIIKLLSNKVETHMRTERDNVTVEVSRYLNPFREDYSELARILGETEMLKRQNMIIETRIHQLDQEILECNSREGKLERDLADFRIKEEGFIRERESLEVKIKIKQQELDQEKIHIDKLSEDNRLKWADYYEKEGEMMIAKKNMEIMSMMQEEFWKSVKTAFKREIECPKIELEYINEYSLRLDEEVRKMRELYVLIQKDVSAFEEGEMARLTAMLGNMHADGHHYSHDYDGKKKQIMAYEMEVLKLRKQLFEKKFAHAQNGMEFLIQIQAKREALSFLKEQSAVMQHEVIRRADPVEIKRYYSTVTHAESEISRDSRRYDSQGRSIITGLTLTPVRNRDDGTVIGWDIGQTTNSADGYNLPRTLT